MIKTYEDWENSLDQNYVRQLSPDAWDLTGSAFEAGQQSQQAKIDELQVRVPEGYVVVPKEPSAELVNHGHQVFLGHFNEGGQTDGRSLYFAYKAMIEAQEQDQ